MRLKFLLFILACTIPFAAHAEKRKEGIVAVVNGSAITASDLDDRLKMILASAKMPADKEVREKIRAQILSGLIEEEIKRQEAQRLKVKIDSSEIDQALRDIAVQNKMSLEEFQKMFRARGLPIKSLRAQIQSQIGWMKVVTREIRPRIEVSESDIDAELEYLNSRLGQDEFLLAEILLPVDRPQDERSANDLAQKLVAKIRKEPESFSVLARQFSRGSSSDKGGDMGWISLDQMPSEMTSDLQAASAGTLIGPFKDATGLHLLFVRERRVRVAENLPSRDGVANKIGMERLDRMQRRHYLDLRSSSFVETRL